MAIRANLDEFLTDPDGTVIVRMTITDDTTFKKPIEYRLKPFNLNDLKTRVRNDAAIIKTPEDPKPVLALGTFDYSVPPPPPPPPPTDEEKARNKFFVDLELRLKMERAISYALKRVDDQDYIDQVALVKAEFLPAYVPFL